LAVFRAAALLPAPASRGGDVAIATGRGTHRWELLIDRWGGATLAATDPTMLVATGLARCCLFSRLVTGGTPIEQRGQDSARSVKTHDSVYSRIRVSPVPWAGTSHLV